VPDLHCQLSSKGEEKKKEEKEKEKKRKGNKIVKDLEVFS
jgi:hypothetical protein